MEAAPPAARKVSRSKFEASSKGSTGGAGSTHVVELKLSGWGAGNLQLKYNESSMLERMKDVTGFTTEPTGRAAFGSDQVSAFDVVEHDKRKDAFKNRCPLHGCNSHVGKDCRTIVNLVNGDNKDFKPTVDLRPYLPVPEKAGK